MTRSSGVTASAVIAILGSICMALLGVLFAFAAIIMGSVELPAPTLSFVIPGSMPRMNAAMQEFLPPDASFDPAVFIWFGLVIGVLTSGVLLWFLLTRRRVFLDACSSPAGAGTHLGAI